MQIKVVNGEIIKINRLNKEQIVKEIIREELSGIKAEYEIENIICEVRKLKENEEYVVYEGEDLLLEIQNLSD